MVNKLLTIAMKIAKLVAKVQLEGGNFAGRYTWRHLVVKTKIENNASGVVKLYFR